MSATYSIYFENNYGQQQNYALFAEKPVVTASSGTPQVYSNVFLSKNLANNSSWNISLTKTNYSFCGVSPTQLQPGVVVSSGSCQMVTLGTSTAPGTTSTMYNNSGSPAFKEPPTMTANPGCYEIDTGTDFTPSLNFVVGLGGIDSLGRQVPMATFDAPRNAKINIQPVVRYYIASYNSSVGTVINTQTVGNPAVIDFAANPGMYAAIVKQASNGQYTVNFAPQAAFASFINAKAIAPIPEPALEKLVQYLKSMNQRLVTDKDEPDSSMVVAGQFACYGTWAPGAAQAAIQTAMNTHMTNNGYVYQNGSIGAGKLSSMFSHAPVDTTVVAAAWQAAWNALGALQPGLTELRVVPNESIEAAQDDDDTLETSKQPTNDINGTNGKSESKEDKKARAMRYLVEQGFGDLTVS